MAKNYARIFRINWAKKYAKEYSKLKRYYQKKAYKDRFYKIIFLTEDEKDDVWDYIMYLCFLEEEKEEKEKEEEKKGEKIDEFWNNKG